MAKKENDLTWCYLYSNGCGPCARVSPMIDAFIATGMKIEKLDVQKVPNHMRRPTPAIFRKNSKDEIVGNIFASLFLVHYSELMKQYPWLFNENAPDPTKLLADMLSTTGIGEFEKQVYIQKQKQE